MKALLLGRGPLAVASDQMSQWKLGQDDLFGLKGVDASEIGTARTGSTHVQEASR